MPFCLLLNANLSEKKTRDMFYGADGNCHCKIKKMKKSRLLYGADAMFYVADYHFHGNLIIKVQFLLWCGCHVLLRAW